MEEPLTKPEIPSESLESGSQIPFWCTYESGPQIPWGPLLESGPQINMGAILVVARDTGTLETLGIGVPDGGPRYHRGPWMSRSPTYHKRP